MKIHWTALTKTLSYRILGMVGTMVIVFVVTGNIKVSAIVGGIEIVLKCIFYYVHEIIWERIIKKFKEKKNA